MSANTAIEWTDATWNPIRARRKDGTGRAGWACERVSPACKHCYAASMNRRLGTGLDYTARGLEQVEVYLDEKILMQPLRWEKPRKVFVCSMTDLFASFVTDEMRDRVFAVMALAQRHTFQVLTKRSTGMHAYFGPSAELDGLTRDVLVEGTAQSMYQKRHGGDPSMWLAVHWPLPNVWLGVTVEDQQRADERIPHLLATPAAVRFLSVEPLLGPVDLTNISVRSTGEQWDVLSRQEADDAATEGECGSSIDWCIVGGESGHGARPMHPDWARSIRNQCVAEGVPFFFKQHGEWAIASQENGIHGSIMPETGGRFTWLGFDGKTQNPSSHGLVQPVWAMGRIGKKRAGRLLDGREWSEFPRRARRPRLCQGACVEDCDEEEGKKCHRN